MTVRAKPKLGCAALALALATWGCHDLEVVGLLGVDAGGAPSSANEGGPEAASAGDGGLVITIDDCQPGAQTGLDAAAIGALLQGGDSSLQWLYPYDGTVFPGGIGAPLLMWDAKGATETAAYVHLHSASFEYRGCMKLATPGQLQIPQEVWAIAGAGTAGAAEPFSLEVRVLSDGVVLGSGTEQVVIAMGSLPGSVYYMTLDSKMGIGLSSVIRVEPGQAGRLILGGVGCVGCHSVAAYGSRLIAYSMGIGTAFALQASASSDPVASNSAPGGVSPGITPDGTLYVASAHPTSVGPRSYGAGVMNAGLYETATGNLVSGSGVPTGAMTPAFSPDGSHLAFNDYALGNGKGLALMSFSESTRSASNYTTLFTDPTSYPAWPSFLPDGQAVVFQLGASSEFSGGGTGLSGGTSPGPQTDLFVVDTASHKSIFLAQAMGFAGGADASAAPIVLPFGASDVHQNYDPSIVPATSGGYAWLFFDSMRHYGNQGSMRAIWGAALDVAADGTYATDPSHPAFFLPGQEVGTGNFRPIAALDP